MLPTHPTRRLIARMESGLMFTLSGHFDTRVLSRVDGQCDSRTVSEPVFLKCILFEYLLRVVCYGSEADANESRLTAKSRRSLIAPGGTVELPLSEDRRRRMNNSAFAAALHVIG